MALRRPRLPLRSYPDPATSTDPAVRAVVDGLRELPPPPTRPEFRAELRAQLVAVTPRLVAEGVTPAAARDGPRPGRLRRVTRPMRRPVAVLAVAATVLVVLLVGAVWLSGSAIPGDVLYGVKRASENVQLSLTSGDVSRGRAYLDLAKTRVEEAASLWSRSSPTSLGAGRQASGAVDPHTASLMTSALNDADSDTTSGAQLLTGAAVRDQTTAPLDSTIAWARPQASRLEAMAHAVPAGALHNRVGLSQQLVQRLLARAEQLKPRVHCACQGTTSSDDLGPLPCLTCSGASPAKPAVPASPARPGGSGSVGSPGSASARSSPRPGSGHGSAS